jgi:hypothetical protein
MAKGIGIGLQQHEAVRRTGYISSSGCPSEHPEQHATTPSLFYMLRPTWHPEPMIGCRSANGGLILRVSCQMALNTPPNYLNLY